MKRVSFLIDGFNVYHSIKDIKRDCNGLSLEWLNLSSLCTSYLPLLGRDSELTSIYYFSAFATHLDDPDIIRRHEEYIKCLKETGIVPILGKFKPKSIKCPSCNTVFIKHEEKETDVAIATKLFEILYEDCCEVAALVTGDTDLIPALNNAKRLFPEKSIVFAFPYRRKNEALAQLAPGSFKIKRDSYARHQFPNPVILSDGTAVSKPLTW